MILALITSLALAAVEAIDFDFAPEFDRGEFVVGHMAADHKSNRQEWCMTNYYKDRIIGIETMGKQITITDAEGNLQAVVDPLRTKPDHPFLVAALLPNTTACGKKPQGAEIATLTAYIGSISGARYADIPLGVDPVTDTMKFARVYGKVEWRRMDDGLLLWSDITRDENGHDGACNNEPWSNAKRWFTLSTQCP